MHKENLQSGNSVHEESGPSTTLDIQSSGKDPQSNAEDHHATSPRLTGSGKHPQSNAEDQHATVTPFQWLKYYIWFLLKYLFIIIVRFKCINVIITKKQKHTLACRTVYELVRHSTSLADDNDGMNPRDTILAADSHLGDERMSPRSQQEHDNETADGGSPPNVGNQEKKGQDKSREEKTDGHYITPFLLAVENGVIEMVTRILLQVPMAIYHQKPSDKKNALLLAVQKRQIDVYDFLINKFESKSEILGKVDKYGNNVLHIAASSAKQGPQLIPGDTMRMLWEMKWYQMQWQTKWYEYVKDSMPGYFFETHNEIHKTPQEIFTDTLKHQLENKDGDRWLEATSEACSVVAGLIATVAFTSATTVPGDYTNGVPTLRRHDAFRVYIISSFLALCFSLTSIITFLNILISGFQKSDYSKSLGQKLLVGLTSLYLSLGSMLVSFFAGHVLILKGKTEHWCLPIYTVGLLPVIIISVMQFNLYFNLLHSVFGRRPQPSYRGFSL